MVEKENIDKSDKKKKKKKCGAMVEKENRVKLEKNYKTE